MGTTQITTTFLLTSLSGVVFLELMGGYLANRGMIPRMELIGALRASQALVVSLLAVVQTGGMGVLGLGKKKLFYGLKQGMIWSFGFAIVAGLMFIGFLLADQNPLKLVHSRSPTGLFTKTLFFVVGGVIAPVAEEIVFRGLIFGYLRQMFKHELFGYLRHWNVVLAVLVSTALFAIIHFRTAIPITQIVGGMVFALAYHKTGSLIAPMVIHMLGNLAIFTLSLPLFS